MLTITVPYGYAKERSYIINMLFSEFLGLKFHLSDSESDVTTIKLQNGNILEINDAFFKEIHDSKENYLNIKYIPSKVINLDLNNSSEKNIVGLYGKPEISFSSHRISCGIDIFASAFFMLTRWEEYVIKDRDYCERFPAKSSLAFKHNFLDRPIVNEYVEVIWHWLTLLGIQQPRKKQEFSFIHTHDIDKISLFETPKDYIAKPIKAILTDKTLSSFTRHTGLAVQSLQGNDPYHVYDYFMDTSEKYNIKSHFFFMAAANKTKFDNGYDVSSKPVRKIIKNIIDRGHVVGIHPSFNTLNNPELLASEINRLSAVTETDITCGRQHYLRFDLPNTWQHWDDNNMQWDSSLAYSEQEGFRCGVCYPFPVFNIITRKKLTLEEKPLIIMDGTIVGAQKQSPTEARQTIDYYISKVRQYSGEFVFLWHNSSFEYLSWKDYRQVYEESFLELK